MAKYLHVVMRAPPQEYKLLPYAQGVHDALLGNTQFPSPYPTLADFQQDIGACADAAAAAKARRPGAAVACQAARGKVRQDLGHLADYVQLVIENLPGEPDVVKIRALVQTVSMDLRKSPVAQKGVFAARYGADAGSVVLTAPASRKRETHDWEFSVDGQVTWTALPSTKQAGVIVKDLAIGVPHHFRHRLLTKDGPTKWSDPTVMIVVK